MCLKWKLYLDRKKLFMYGSWNATFKSLREILNGVNLKKTLYNKNSKMLPRTDRSILSADVFIESPKELTYTVKPLHNGHLGERKLAVAAVMGR